MEDANENSKINPFNLSVDNATAMKYLYCSQNDDVPPLWRESNRLPQTSPCREIDETTDNTYHKVQIYAEKVKDIPYVPDAAVIPQTSHDTELAEATNNEYPRVQMYAEKFQDILYMCDTSVTVTTQETEIPQISHYTELADTINDEYNIAQIYAKKVKDILYVSDTAVTVTTQERESPQTSYYIEPAETTDDNYHKVQIHAEKVKATLSLPDTATTVTTQETEGSQTSYYRELAETIDKTYHRVKDTTAMITTQETESVTADTCMRECHVCNISVHLRHMDKHKVSSHHKSCLELAKHAMMRITQHISENMSIENGERDNTIIYNKHYCDVCNLEIDSDSLNSHEDGEMHVLCLSKAKLFADLLQLYIENRVNSDNVVPENSSKIINDDDYDSCDDRGDTVKVVDSFIDIYDLEHSNKENIYGTTASDAMIRFDNFKSKINVDEILSIVNGNSKYVTVDTIGVKDKVLKDKVEHPNLLNDTLKDSTVQLGTGNVVAPHIRQNENSIHSTVNEKGLKDKIEFPSGPIDKSIESAQAMINRQFILCNSCNVTVHKDLLFSHSLSLDHIIKVNPISICACGTNTKTTTMWVHAKHPVTTAKCSVTNEGIASICTDASTTAPASKVTPVATTTTASTYTPATNEVTTSKSAPVTSTATAIKCIPTTNAATAITYTPVTNKANTSRSAPVATTTTASKYTPATNTAIASKSATSCTTSETTIATKTMSTKESAGAISTNFPTPTTFTASSCTTSVNTITSSQPIKSTFCNTCKFTLKTVDFYNHLMSFEHKRNLRKRKFDNTIDTEKDYRASLPKKMKENDSDVEIIETVQEIIVIEDGDDAVDVTKKADNTKDITICKICLIKFPTHALAEHVKTKYHKKISAKLKVKGEAQSLSTYDPETYCQMCKVTYGVKNRDEHLNGARHNKNLKKVQNSQVNTNKRTATTVKDDRPIPKRNNNFAMAYYNTNEVYCYLCNVPVPLSNKMQHENGWKHRSAAESAKLNNLFYY